MKKIGEASWWRVCYQRGLPRLVLCRGQPFNPTTRTCRLCLTEIHYLMYCKNDAALKQRSELYLACRQMTRMLISNALQWWKYPMTFSISLFLNYDVVRFMILDTL